MAVKYLVSDKTGDHLPYTDASGSPDHRLMGAAWAALHGGYRGNKYAGSGNGAALTKLEGVYKSEKMTTPQESFFVPAPSESLMYEADGVTQQTGSFSAIRDRVQAAIDQCIRDGEDMDLDGDNDAPNGSDPSCYAWIMDLFPTTVVYSMDGDLFQCEYHDDGETVTLGTPVEVEQSYTVVPDDSAEDAAQDQESHREICRETLPLSESAYDAKNGKLTMTIIQPGFNTSKSRYYPASVLKRDAPIFEGAKMFSDHQTEAENKARPEGSVNKWVASVGKPWVENDGRVRAVATVIDPPFKEKLATLQTAGLLHEMGISIRAVGQGSEAKIEGQKTNLVEGLVAARSVDFVTFPGAGGHCEVFESDRNDENDVDVLSLQQLQERRPDLIALVESHHREELNRLKTLEQQLQEAQAAKSVAEAKAADLQKQVTEAEAVQKKSAAAGELTQLLTEAKLPKPAEDRLRKQFSEAKTSDGMKAAIAAEGDYIKAIAPGVTSATKVTRMGTKANGTEEVSKEVDLTAGFRRLGLSESEAEIAAGTQPDRRRHAVNSERR